MRTIVVKRRGKISGLYLAAGIKKRNREARKAVVATDPYTVAIGEGVINSIVDFAATCMVPAITIIALSGPLVNLNRFTAHRTWVFIPGPLLSEMSPQRDKRLRKNALDPVSPSKMAVRFVAVLSQQASNFGQKNVALALGRTFE